MKHLAIVLAITLAFGAGVLFSTPDESDSDVLLEFPSESGKATMQVIYGLKILNENRDVIWESDPYKDDVQGLYDNLLNDGIIYNEHTFTGRMLRRTLLDNYRDKIVRLLLG